MRVGVDDAAGSLVGGMRSTKRDLAVKALSLGAVDLIVAAMCSKRTLREKL